MERYEMTRDCGRPWLGQIPRHWKILRMKNVFEVVSERNHPDAEVLSLYREYGVLPKSSRDDNYNVTSEDTASYKFVRVDDLVINKMKAWQGSLGISQYEGIVSPAYYVCRFINDGVSKRYYHYLLRSKTYAQEFERLSTGMRVGQWDLGIDDFMKVPALIPPLEEQQAIAAYLDDQVGQIDSIIAEAQASIDEYKQWKASVIFEAVTKGLNPDVEMKESGIEWIGKIPVNWHMCPIKRLTTKIGSGKTPSGGAEVYSDEGVLFLRSQNVYDTGLILEDVSHISDEIDSDMKNTRVEYKDVLLNITGGSIGRCCLFDLPGVRANVNQHVCILRTKQTDLMPEFLRYFWNSAIGSVVVSYYQTGGNRQGLNFEQIGRVKIPLCPLDTQKSIVEFLDKRCATINELIAEKHGLIKDMEAFKRSLIYEIVTGKRKVV